MARGFPDYTWMTNPLPVVNGGTGVQTLAQHGVLIGNTAAGVNVTAAGNPNDVLQVPGGGGDPVFAPSPTVLTFNTRAGAVVPAAGDYTLDQISDTSAFERVAQLSTGAIVIENAGFEASASLPVPGWTSITGSYSYETASPQAGNQSLIVTGASGCTVYSTRLYLCQSGEIYKLSGYVLGAGGATAKLLLRCFTKGGAYISDPIYLTDSSGSWVLKSGTGTIPANTSYFRIALQVAGSGTVTGKYDSIVCARAVNLPDEVTGVLAIANGGTGSATAAISSGVGISVTGSFPNVTVARAVPDSVRAYNSANISVGSGAAQTLNFDSEHWDTNNLHDLVTHNERLTCQVAGKYHIYANLMFAANGTGIRDVLIVHSSAGVIAQQRAPADATYNAAVNASTEWTMAVNDYVTCQAIQSSGGNLNVIASATVSPEFGMTWLGP